MSENQIVEAWNKIKTLVESMEIDVQKSVAGNVSAGVRARRGLRLLKHETVALVRSMVAFGKNQKEAK